jgi:predicted DNA-binding transcriptional regulator AlpA
LWPALGADIPFDDDDALWVEVSMSRKSSLSRPRAPARGPDRILSLRQWADINNFSLRTAQRLVDSADAPPIVQLTTRRIGIRESDAAAWQAARVRGQSA